MKTNYRKSLITNETLFHLTLIHGARFSAGVFRCEVLVETSIGNLLEDTLNDYILNSATFEIIINFDFDCEDFFRKISELQYKSDLSSLIHQKLTVKVDFLLNV